MGIAFVLYLFLALFVLVSSQNIRNHLSSSGDDRNDPCVLECPQSCTCNSDTTVMDCSARGLQFIPNELRDCDWNEVRLLNLSKNRIERIQSGAFINFPNLDRLFLYNNHINDIDDNAFIGLSNLTLLSLDGNNLTTLPSNVFKDLTSLGVLLIYSNRISSLPSNVFNGLSNLAVLSIHENQLTRLDKELFSGLHNLQRLYSQDNNIYDLSDAPFYNLKRLVLLYLSGNRLTELTNTSFTGLRRLHTLVIRNNLISSISSDTFSHTPNLNYLYMDYNRITTVTKKVLSPFNRLFGLTLAGNQINVIEDEAFAKTNYIQTLYLQGNRLQNLTQKTFRGLYNLRELVLYQNQISTLPANAFANSRFLRRLWLQNNRIQCLNEEAFTGLVNLQLLHLANNEIAYLPRYLFQPTSSLAYLILSSNKLTRIETHPFRNLKNLIQLALFYNSISHISEGAFDGSDRLTYIQWNVGLDFARDNRLSCDCGASWLKDFIFAQRPYYASIICGSGPSGARGQSVSRVSFTNCSRDMKLSMTPLPLMSYVSEGSCLELKCKPSRPMEMSWSKIINGHTRPILETYLRREGGGCSAKPVDSCGNTIDTEGLLTIPYFTKNDQGTYYCSVTENNDTFIAMRHIQIGERPVILKSPESVRARDPPSHVLFELVAKGNPSPTIQWYRDSIPINISSTIRMHLTSTGSLIILNPIKEDSGVYTVVVDNGAGSVQATVTLSIYYGSTCFRGQGCQNNGSCLPYYYCICPQGYSGQGCEIAPETVSVSTTSKVSTPAATPVQYSGDYYSGDYYSGDYYYSGDNDNRQKRGIIAMQRTQYDYDIIDTSSQEEKVKVHHRQHHKKKLTKNKRKQLKISKPKKNSLPPIELLDISKLSKELPLAVDVNDLPKDIQVFDDINK